MSEKTTMKITVSIDVPDLQQAVTFYTEALGCTKVRDQGGDMVVIATENCHIYLQEKEAGTIPTPLGDITREYSRHWTPVHLDFITKDIVEVVERVVRLGGTREGGDSGEWGSIAYCADPFGNGFCMINE